MSAKDFLQIDKTALEDWNRAVILLNRRGITLETERARGGNAAGYFAQVEALAMETKYKPLPLPPLPLP